MKSKLVDEYFVYKSSIEFLKFHGWEIICASPPVGTNGRYKKCLFPRRELDSGQKGPRDEVDIISRKNGVILLIECKLDLSDSFLKKNRLLEGDVEKLSRITDSYNVSTIESFINQGIGITISDTSIIIKCLAVFTVDAEIPSGFLVISTKTNPVTFINQTDFGIMTCPQ